MIPLGIALGAGSKAISALGLVLQKLAHIKNARKRSSQRIGYVFNPLWVFGFAIYFGGNIIHLAALALAPQSIIGAMDALLPVFNALYAPRLLGEEVILRDWAANAVIVLGVILVVAFGPIGDEEYELDDLVTMLYAMPYLAYALSVLGFVVVAVLVQECCPRLEACSPMNQKGTCANSFAAILAGLIAAALSGFNQQLSKVFGILVGHVFEGEDDLRKWESWFFIGLLLVMCLVQVNRLQKALQEHISLVVVPVFQVGIVIFSVAGGGLYFDEFAAYDGRGMLPPFFFGIGIFLACAGVFAVAGGREDTGKIDEDSQRTPSIEERPSKRWTLPLAKGDMSEGERLYLMTRIPNQERVSSPPPGDEPPVVEGAVVSAVLKDNSLDRHRPVRTTFGGVEPADRRVSLLRSVERRISILLVPFGAGGAAVAALQSIAAEHAVSEAGPAEQADRLDDDWVIVAPPVDGV